MDQPTGDVWERVKPQVDALASFLTSAPLSNRTTARIDPGIANLLAEAIIRWQNGEVYDEGAWVDRGEVMPTPDAGEVRAETLADGAVIKLTHLPTGITTLGENPADAYADLRRKVQDHGTD